MRKATIVPFLWVVLSVSSCQISQHRPIVFGSFRDGNWEVYVLSTSDAPPINLTRHDDIDQEPDLSLDGKQIVFASNRDDNDEIYRMEQDGSNVTRLTNHPAWDRQPRWSPDGQAILFVSDRDENQELYLMDPQGKHLKRLTHNPASDYDPVWSPDGKSIAFISERDAGVPELYRLNVSDNKIQRLTHDSRWKGRPTWSSQGDQMALLIETNHQMQPAVVSSIDGTLSTVNLPGQTLDIHWASTKHWLLTRQEQQHTRLWRMEWPSLQLQPLLSNSQWDRQPDS